MSSEVRRKISVEELAEIKDAMENEKIVRVSTKKVSDGRTFCYTG